MVTTTDQEIAEVIAEIMEQYGDDPAMLEEVTEYFNFHAALDRAIARHGDHDLRGRCDPCIVRCCRWSTAITRCHVRYYLGTENPPAPGSSYSTCEHWDDVVKELRLMGFPDAKRCDGCERLWAYSHRGCRGGSCSPRPAAVAS